MNPRFSSSDDDDLIQAERDVQARIGDLDIDFAALGVISNIFRAANAIRAHMERHVLAAHGLSFTAFTTLWVLWVWGEQEARHLAAGAGISKGTLTGVVSTLERRGLAERRSHPSDGRLVLIAPTEAGCQTMAHVFPAFNGQESALTAGLSPDAKAELAAGLRIILTTLESESP